MLLQRRHFGNDGAFAVVSIIITIVRDNLLSASQEGQARSAFGVCGGGRRVWLEARLGQGGGVWWRGAPEGSGGVGGAGGRGAARGGADSRTPAG